MFYVFSSSPPLRELKGVVTSLSSDGHLLCSYMGTDPSFFSTPKVDAREADYEQVEAEMKKLQKLIREATRTQGGVSGPSVTLHAAAAFWNLLLSFQTSCPSRPPTRTWL